MLYNRISTLLWLHEDICYEWIYMYPFLYLIMQYYFPRVESYRLFRQPLFSKQKSFYLPYLSRRSVICVYKNMFVSFYYCCWRLFANKLTYKIDRKSKTNYVIFVFHKMLVLVEIGFDIKSFNVTNTQIVKNYKHKYS